MKLPAFLPIHDTIKLHYAVRIFIGTAVLWFLLQYTQDKNPLWAIISLIVVTEPKLDQALMAFQARIIHTCIGCGIGFIFLLLVQVQGWMLPFALTTAVLASSYLTKVQQSWRVGPVTAALIISTGLTHTSFHDRIEFALNCTFEVMLGSVAALIVTWFVSLLWSPPNLNN